MDHGEVLARLGDAALERDGIRRLLASDPGLAAHVDACRTCAAERDAWLRATDALAEALAPGQSPEEAAGSPVALPAGLRDRTLRVAAARGIARPVTAAAPASSVTSAPAASAPVTSAPSGSAASAPSTPAGSAVPAPVPSTPPIAGVVRIARPSRWRSRRLLQPLAAAAVVVVLLGGGGLVADLAGQRDQATRQRDQARGEAQQLAGVAGTLDALLAEPGHRVASLASTATGSPVGSVVWGPVSSRLAVVTGALAAPPPGSAYRCWVERDGVRHVIGQMEFGEGLAYWAGWVDPASGIGPGSRIGVSLVKGTGGGAPPEVLLASF